MKIYLAADHGGFELKNQLHESLSQAFDDFEFVDLGPAELDPNDDYPDFAFKVANKVSEDGMTEDLNHNSLGILVCRSGNGMVIAANKINGAYAALCFNTKHAQKAREDDNANIICIDADYDGEDPIEIVKTFLTSNFAGADTRHGRRFKKILEREGA